MKERPVDLTIFQKIPNLVVAKNEDSWNDFFFNRHRSKRKTYTLQEIDNILEDSSLTSQQTLSRYYYERNGLYKKIILYYASLLTYSSLLIPNPSIGKRLSSSYIQKRYFLALNYLEKANLVELMTRMTLRTLIDGCYYGIIQTLDKDNLVLFDLPSAYARSRFRDIYGNDIVEFDVTYFDSIVEESSLKQALKIYPKDVSNHYNKFKKGKVSSPWVALSSDIGVCFSFFDDCRPIFLDIIPATVQYDDAVETEREKELEEIRKIIVQKIPHLSDGQLLFEPDEALEMHRGAVKMMGVNANLSVLTTYADVDAIVSKTSADNLSNSLEKMLQNVYSEAGVSGQIFAPTGSQALSTSIKNDISVMMILANKYARFIGYVVNTLFSNANISFKFIILPVSLYNQSDYISDTFKLAQSGYSYLQVAAAAGLSQNELRNIKSLENDVLKLRDILIPLSSAYTESASDSKEVGAPEKKLEEKAVKTIQNEESLDRQGGSE